MPNTSVLQKYLKSENVKDGDIIKFVDAGVIVTKTFKKDGKDEARPALEITVNYKGENKTYSPNATTVKLLNAGWGTDTEEWVGKCAFLTILPSGNGKDMIVAKPKLEI